MANRGDYDGARIRGRGSAEGLRLATNYCHLLGSLFSRTSCFLPVLRAVVQSGSVRWQSDGTSTSPAGRPGWGDAKAVLALGRRASPYYCH